MSGRPDLRAAAAFLEAEVRRLHRGQGTDLRSRERTIELRTQCHGDGTDPRTVLLQQLLGRTDDVDERLPEYCLERLLVLFLEKVGELAPQSEVGLVAAFQDVAEGTLFGRRASEEERQGPHRVGADDVGEDVRVDHNAAALDPASVLRVLAWVSVHRHLHERDTKHHCDDSVPGFMHRGVTQPAVLAAEPVPELDERAIAHLRDLLLTCLSWTSRPDVPVSGPAG